MNKGWTNERSTRSMDGRMEGRMNGRMDGRMVGTLMYTNRCYNIVVSSTV